MDSRNVKKKTKVPLNRVAASSGICNVTAKETMMHKMAVQGGWELGCGIAGRKGLRSRLRFGEWVLGR